MQIEEAEGRGIGRYKLEHSFRFVEADLTRADDDLKLLIVRRNNRFKISTFFV